MTYIDRPTDYIIIARRSRRGTEQVRATCPSLALRASSVQGAEAIEIDARAGVVLAVELVRQLFQAGIVGKRPVPRNPE